MRIGLVVPEFPPDSIGGGGVVFEGLARTLHARGHEVRILSSSTVDGPALHDEAYPFPILRVPQFKHFTPQFRTYMPPRPLALFSARKFLGGVDVYHLHGYGTVFIDAVFNLLVDARRAVFTSHGLPYTAPRSGPLLRTAYGMYDALFGKNVLRRARRLSAVSPAAADELAIVSGRHVACTPNGFEPIIATAPPSGPIAATIAKGRYLLGVGRIEPRKGFDLLVKALGQLREQGNDLRLVIAGADNSQQGELVEIIRNAGLGSHVSLLGRIQRDELVHVYKNAAYFVVSSHTESFGMITLEAMNEGVPCVLSAIGGMLDIGRDRENAVFFTPGDAFGIVSAVEKLERSPDLREALRANGHSTVARYRWSNVIGRYEDLYSSVLEPK